MRPKPAGARAASIPKRKRQNHCLLSFDQERIWIIDRMEPGNPAYNIYTASRLLGPLDLPAMERAVNEIVKRHEILRTTFTTVEGEPVMVISRESTLRLPVQDISSVDEDERLSEARRLVNHATALPFDLEAGPLLRVGVIRLGVEDHVVHVTMHHTITDRWSAAVLEQEMVAIYSAFTEGRPSPLPPIEIQFADFAEWQRDWLQGEVLAAKVDYWKNQLSGAPLVLDLPSDRPRPPFQKFRGARELINLPEPLLKRLKALTQREGVTMFMTLLAAYNLLLYRYTGQEDILVGLAMANRNRPETENMLGYLLNMVIIRARFSARTTFRELLEVVRQSAVGAFANLDLPLGSLIEELKPSPDPSRNPIFQVAYIYLDFPPEAGMESLKVKPVPLEADNGASRFDITLALTELPDRLETLIEFNTDIFDHETIQRMLQHLRVLLEGIAVNADLALCELPILTDSETRHLLENWNNSDAPFPRDL
ncbi:MAG TPA: condensation domain-containing protein, partial [Blastocatellia bacterium]|nr:condensation domain-containing protein [Blastocatellia bacterium]